MNKTNRKIKFEENKEESIRTNKNSRKSSIDFRSSIDESIAKSDKGKFNYLHKL
jgi:hypothetical protein